MKRRDLLTLLGGGIVTSARLAEAQQSRRMPRIAILWHAANAEEEGPYLEAVRQGLRDLGYVEGRTMVLDNRFPNETPELFRSMAVELVSLKPDVLLAAGASASIAAKNTTTTVPVVFMVVPDPLGSNLVGSLARPGGNVTGLTNFAVQLSAKRLEYLKEAFPGLSRVALLINPNVQITRRYIEESEAAAPKLGITLQLVEARSLEDLPRAFDAMVKAGAQAVAVNAEGLFFQGRALVAQLALARRLPTCVYSRETLEAGALMSYGPDQRAIFRRAAVYVDKILKGTKPAELPVEQPTRFEFLVNQQTAKRLGVTIPPSVLLRADQVVE
jgi:putative tryptophan/tyrosine transport system substrate-binding protein